jgi:uncharacterized protein
MKSLPFVSFKDYCLSEYGVPLFKVPLDLGAGCPNRSKNGSGGCSFCPEDGALAQQIKMAVNIEDQVKRGIRFARDRYGAKKFIAYFQTFSNTVKQKILIDKVLLLADFECLAIGTRPDCLDKKTIDWLASLKDVWVELGVQTIHNRTLEAVNRGHTWEQSKEAILALAERGIKVIVHVIVGLPGETWKDFMTTAEALKKLPLTGIKIHNLHVVKGTKLADIYAKKPFKVYLEHEYCEILVEFIRRLPRGLPIMRLSTDTPKRDLIAPYWALNKLEFLEMVARNMECYQEFVPVKTEDGSITFWHEGYKEHFHTKAGAYQESVKKYIDPAPFLGSHIELLDVCFGLGYNSFAAIDYCRKHGKKLTITALEIDRKVLEAAAKYHEREDWRGILVDLLKTGESDNIKLLWGDARYTVNKLDRKYDLIFLDAFSPGKTTELWTVDFFKKLRKLMKPQGALLTYCAALPVRGGLMRAGWYVGETAPFGRERGGSIATLDSSLIDMPLSEKEFSLIKNTLKGVPWRDPWGVWRHKKILSFRQKVLNRCYR